MENNSIENMFCMTLGSDNVRLHEPMKKHTTFRIGGPADYYLCPHSTEELQKILQICKENKMEFFVLGNGSNLLVSDKGYRGVVIQLWKNFSDIVTKEDTITVKAGALLSKVAAEALEEGLTGMEFASGIPGTIGGAVVMNAGAYGGEMKDIIKEVTVLTKEGDILTISKEEMNFGYRTSVVKEKGYVVISVVLQLKKGDRAEIRKVMDDLKERRVTKQPLDMPSAGSTFKRPEGYFAGKLIM
ncbi:MAG: UDP-N-acetylmuramate dehydrogenase, partial [Blautia sp.]|nr:UDP-N-acetylmuramate dehydrogenase [Blautia sp.]